MDYEIYVPSYIDCGGNRPTINQAPTILNYDQLSYAIDYSIQVDAVEEVILMRPGSTTHHFDFDQRMVKLKATVTPPNSISFDAPTITEMSMAPPGYYMLFLVSDQGIPSVATWVHLS